MTALASGTVFPRAAWACALLAWAAVAGVPLRGQTPASAPAPAPASAPSADAALEAELEWLGQALAAAQDSRDRLRQLRSAAPQGSAPASSPTTRGAALDAQVAAALKQGLGVLAAADGRLADPALKAPPMPAARPAPKPDQWQAAFRSLVRLRRCQAALFRVELYQAAAEAGAPGEAARDAHLANQIEACRSLRVEYRDVPLSMLGYVFESRAHRLAGKAEASLAALETVLKMAAPPEDKQLTDLVRLAKVERLETLLLSDRSAAAKEGLQWRASKELKDEPLWRARIDWVLARGAIEDLRSRRAKGAPPPAADVQKCADLLRAESLVEAVAQWDRLEALAALDAIGGGKVITRQELLDWAGLLAGAGRDDATAVFDRVLAMEGAPLEAGQMLAFAAVLWKQGQWLRAADVCDRVLQRLDPADEQAPGVLQARAAALLKAAATQPAGPGPGRDALRTRLAAALRPVFESNLPAPARREALLHWVSLSGDLAPAKLLAVLARRQELVRGSAYLLYCQATRSYAALQPSLAAPAAQSQPDARKQVEAVLAGLRAAQAAAAEANDAPLLACSILAQAQVLSRPPPHDVQAALQLLTGRRRELDADRAVATDAAWLRVQLNMDLGLVDAASKELESLPDQGGVGQAGVPLRLAEALAARQASADDASRGRLRAQVISLCNRAMVQALADANTYVGVARRCSRTLLAAGAGADAERILGELLGRPAVLADADAHLDCRLMLARALQAEGKNTDAAKQFDDLAAKFPGKVATHAYRGRYQLSVKQPDRAAESFRAARKLAKEGSADWCEATLDLSAALSAQGQSPAAADILRVARALHPAFGNDELRARLIRAQEQLGSARPGAEVAR